MRRIKVLVFYYPNLRRCTSPTVLIRLDHEVSSISDILYAYPEFSAIASSVFSRRRSPKFSLLSYVLTTDEDSVVRSGSIKMKRSAGLDTS